MRTHCLVTLSPEALDTRDASYSCLHYATHLYCVSGHRLDVVREKLGHSTIKTTTIYARYTKEDKLPATNALVRGCRDNEKRRSRITLPSSSNCHSEIALGV